MIGASAWHAPPRARERWAGLLELVTIAARPVAPAHDRAAAMSDAADAQRAATDEALMAQVGGGDARAYRVLADRYLPGIVRYATRMLCVQAEAEEIAQETFLRLWRDAGRYEARGFRASTWLYRIAHNLCVDRLRARKPEGSGEELVASERTSTPQARQEIAEQVAAALAALPERQRAAIALVHYEEKSHEEAAQVLGCGVEAVESLLSRARKALRERLAAYYGEGP
jgi:RNA polymerase sigma-70 factor (ECF subfamily)